MICFLSLTCTKSSWISCEVSLKMLKMQVFFGPRRCILNVLHGSEMPPMHGRTTESNMCFWTIAFGTHLFIRNPLFCIHILEAGPGFQALYETRNCHKLPGDIRPSQGAFALIYLPLAVFFFAPRHEKGCYGIYGTGLPMRSSRPLAPSH